MTEPGREAPCTHDDPHKVCPDCWGQQEERAKRQKAGREATAQEWLDERKAALDAAEAEYAVVLAEHHRAYDRLMMARRRYNNAGRDWADAAARAALSGSKS